MTPTSIGPNGARARISGGNGVTYYWPAGAAPDRRQYRHRRRRPAPGARSRSASRGPGAPISGVADVRALHRARLAPGAGADPLRRRPDGSTRVSTRRPARRAVPGRPGAGAAAADRGAGRRAAAASPSAPPAPWSASIMLQYRVRCSSAARGLPVCPIGPAIIAKPAGGAGHRPTPGSGATDARWPARQVAVPAHASPPAASPASNSCSTGSATRLGKRAIADPVRRRAAERQFRRRRASTATFAGAKATIGNVPLLLSEGRGKWRLYHGDLTVDTQR